MYNITRCLTAPFALLIEFNHECIQPHNLLKITRSFGGFDLSSKDSDFSFWILGSQATQAGRGLFRRLLLLKYFIGKYYNGQ